MVDKFIKSVRLDRVYITFSLTRADVIYKGKRYNFGNFKSYVISPGFSVE